MRTHLMKFAMLALLSMSASMGFAQSNPTFPALVGQVVDQAQILNATVEAALTEQLAAHEAQTTNQIVVVTVNSLEGYSEADYALRLGREWGIGVEDKNNGIIFLVAPNERKVRIEVGYGLEGALPDGLAGQIIDRQVLPSFKKSNYSSGIQSGVTAILQAVAGEYKAEPYGQNNRNKKQPKGFDFIPLFFIGMVAVPAFLRSRGLQRGANAAFPGGFAGLATTVISGNFIIGILMGIGIFGALYLFNPNPGGDGRGGNGRGGRGGFGGGMGGMGGGGGFSGGGGSFGGGGASGSW